MTAYAAGRVPDSYAAALDAADLRGTRIGVIRDADGSRGPIPENEGYRQVRAVIDRAIEDLRSARRRRRRSG